MEIPTETLKLRTQQYQVGSNEILNSVRVRRVKSLKMEAVRLDVLEPGHAFCLPGHEGVGWHQDT
jgi:hypothetical protein